MEKCTHNDRCLRLSDLLTCICPRVTKVTPTDLRVFFFVFYIGRIKSYCILYIDTVFKSFTVCSLVHTVALELYEPCSTKNHRLPCCC